MNKRVCIVSLGCPKNLVDSEVMLYLLSQNGYQITNSESDAHIIIVNTCGFIESAKEESIIKIIEMGKMKKEANCEILIVSGCLSERYNEELFRELPEVDAMIGTGDYKNIVSVIESAYNGKKVVKYGNFNTIDIEYLPRRLSSIGATSYIKIAEGCNNRCAYCIIPFLRGKYRSRSIESILNEAKELAQSGIKEIILIAQDTAIYGIDIYGRSKIGELLNEISKINGIEWIRLMYTYPEHITDDLVEEIACNTKVCKYIDMPIQHISNSIIKRMNRKGSKEKIINLITKVRKEIPDICIRTTFIVGFPGETKEDFNELYDFIKETKFDRLGVFAYSKEEGTAAFELDAQVEEDIKQKRLHEIMLLQNKISYENNKKFIDKTIKVIIESEQNGKYVGRSYRDAPDIDGLVYFTSSKRLYVGEICNVLIREAMDYDLQGEYTNEYCK